jgi:hypothetical protein
VLLALVLAVAACGGGDDDDEAATLSDIYAVGNCFNLTEDGNLAEDAGQIVDCGTPHYGEIVAHLTAPGDAEAAFPGVDALRETAAPECNAAMEAYTGVPLTQLDLGAILLFPTEQSWADGDRVVLCAASRDPELLQGSIAAGTDGSPTAPTSAALLPEPEVGQCYTTTDPLTLAGAQVVDCAQEHTGEVFAVIGAGAADAEFPGGEALAALAGTECGAALGPFIGGEPPPEVVAYPYLPTGDQWAQGDRDLECAIVAADGGTITGSARGAGS